MKHFSIILFCIGLVGFPVFASGEAAIDQLHCTVTEDLAATTYYDEVTKGDPNAHNTSFKEKRGEMEIKKNAAGIDFDTPSAKTSVTKTGTKKVDEYIVKDNQGNEVVMKSPAANIPAPSQGDIDDMFLNSLGTGAQVQSDYKGTYDTAVGETKEGETFDISAQLASAEKKQQKADAAFNAANPPQRAVVPSSQSSDKEEGGFWSNLGKVALQGLAKGMADMGTGSSSGGSGNAATSSDEWFCCRSKANCEQCCKGHRGAIWHPTASLEWRCGCDAT